MSTAQHTLPPGQRRVRGFPRFGTHLHHPPPAIPPNPTIEISGVMRAPLVITPADLDDLPQVEQVADFHCVAGWTTTDLRWAGVGFATVYRTLVEPRLPSGAEVTHIVFRGADGYGSTVCIEDALADDVLIATKLDGAPLTPDHGAPVRLVSPSQYGFISTKHLCGIELHAGKPRDENPFDVITRAHPHARVWREERHRWFPAGVVRPVYRALVRPIARLSARGSG